MTEPVANPAEKPKEPLRHHEVAALWHILQESDPGTLAALRRADPAAPPAVFYRITVEVLDARLSKEGHRRAAEEARWAIVLSAMASALSGGARLLAMVPLGEALARANVAEMRVLRLLEAQEAQLADLVRHIVHQLVQKAQPFNPHDLADLVLTAGTERAHAARRNIARDFYRHQGT